MKKSERLPQQKITVDIFVPSGQQLILNEELNILLDVIHEKIKPDAGRKKINKLKCTSRGWKDYQTYFGRMARRRIPK